MGSPGIKGDKGTAGLHGLGGMKGEKGNMGLPGLIGQTGPSGRPGMDGEKGKSLGIFRLEVNQATFKAVGKALYTSLFYSFPLTLKFLLPHTYPNSSTS